MAFGERELVVRVIGDASSLEKTFRKASTSTNRFGKDMNRTFRGVVVGSGAFRSLGRSVAFASSAFLGGVGLTAVVKGAFDEMSHAQQVAAQTAAAIKSTGGVAGVTAKHVEGLGLKLMNLSGVNDEVVKSSENLLLTFTNIRNVAGKGNQIFDRTALLGLDISTRKQQELSTVSLALGKALQDPVKGLTALRRVGLTFTKQQEKTIKSLVESGHLLEAQKKILDVLEVKYKGSAAAAGGTLAGKLNILKENVLNVEGAIATLLLPAITKLVDRLVKWTQNTNNQKRVLNDAKQVMEAVAGAANVLKGAFDGLNTITGSTKHTVELLFGALAAYKTLKIASSLKAIADNIGLIGSNARKARGGVEGLPGGLGGPAGPAAPPSESTAAKIARNIGKTGAVLAVAFAGAKGLQKLIGQAPLLISPQSLRLGVRSPAVPGIFQPQGPPGPVRPPAGILGPITAAAAGARRPGTTPPPPPPVDPKFQRAANEAFRALQVDRAAFRVEQTQLTKGITDDIAANEKLNDLLLKRIHGRHKTLDLQRQQLQVQLTINSLIEQQTAARKQAAHDARQAREFAILGLDPSGQPRTPGVGALRRELSAVLDSPLDKKARAAAERIRKVLKRGAEAVTKDVRATIKQMLDDMKGQLDKSGVDVTRFQKTARGQLTLAGAHPTGVVITGDVHFHGVQNVKQLENELAKRARARAHARRSTR